MTSERPSDLIGRRIRETRTRQGLTAKDLADKCDAAGAPELTAAVIANIETGRRGKDGRRRREVTADELLILALALGVTPAYLILPLNGYDRLKVTPAVEIDPVVSVLWLTGEVSSPDLDITIDDERKLNFRTQRPIEVLKSVWLFTVVCMAAVRREPPETGLLEVATQRLGKALDELLAMGLTPPSMPRAVVDAMRANGSLAHPGEIPTWNEGESPDWLPSFESVVGLVDIMVHRSHGGIPGDAARALLSVLDSLTADAGRSGAGSEVLG